MNHSMRNGERGIVIPTVLVCLVALTALNLAMSIASQSEVLISGVQQRNMASFHAADGGINYSLGLVGNFDDPSDTAAYNTEDLGLPFKATVGVTYLPPVRLPPPGLRVSALKVASFHFLMTSTGELAVVDPHAGPAPQPPTRTAIEMEASKLGPAPLGP